MPNGLLRSFAEYLQSALMTGYAISKEEQIVYTFFSGKLTTEEILAHCEKLRTDPAFDPAFSEITDLRAVSNMDMTFSDMRTVVGRDPFSKTAKRAVITRPHTFQYGMTRMWMSAHENDGHIKTFGSRRDARRWINHQHGNI